VEAVRTLLELGADPSLQTPNGKTARWIAEARGYREVIALLPAGGPGYESPSLVDRVRGRVYRLSHSIFDWALRLHQANTVREASKRRTKW
jgi:hypothetical protein